MDRRDFLGVEGQRQCQSPAACTHIQHRLAGRYHLAKAINQRVVGPPRVSPKPLGKVAPRVGGPLFFPHTVRLGMFNPDHLGPAFGGAHISSLRF